MWACSFWNVGGNLWPTVKFFNGRRQKTCRQRRKTQGRNQVRCFSTALQSSQMLHSTREEEKHECDNRGDIINRGSSRSFGGFCDETEGLANLGFRHSEGTLFYVAQFHTNFWIDFIFCNTYCRFSISNLKIAILKYFKIRNSLNTDLMPHHRTFIAHAKLLIMLSNTTLRLCFEDEYEINESCI